MDKNTIIGLLLITAIIVAFTIYNRPSKEQIAEQKRLRDSIALVEAQQAEIATELGSKQASTSLSDDSVLGQGSSLSDFFRAGTPYNEAINDSTSEVTILANEPVNEEIVVLENDKIRLLLNTKGGKIQSVQLKEYLHYKGDSLYLFENDQESRFNLELFNRNSLRISTENEYFTPIKSADGKTVIMRLQNSSEQYIDLVYTLPEDEYMLDFDIRISGMRNGLHPESLANFKLNWEQKVRQQEKGRAFENRYSRIHYKYDKQDDSKLSESKNDQKELPDPIKWFAFKDQYFSAIVIADKPFNNTILTSQLLNDSEYIKNYKAEVWAPVEISTESDLISAGFKYYFGPVHYNTLKSYDDGVSNNSDKLELEEIVSLGYKWLSWVNKWFVIPVFNYFLTLNWGMGLIILILTIMVKIIISPLTYKSYISSAKMRVLRPQIQEIEKKYPGQEQDMMMKRQQATMELYSKAGVSPMSGCLPMLIQMPVLLALFFFFPSAIELRQQSFLWADDLSTFDSLISWSGNIPIITRFLGNHISIFCLLMTITNVIYTKYNMASMDTGQQTMPGMKNMPLFMSVFMFFFLNSYPSGLNYYYFLSTLITIVITLIMKKVIDEEKILAQLEENKKKPRKKSGFMARLQEAQKLQEKQAREQAKQNAKRNYRK
ncbi:MAG TPA: membrane protein insertase YidC [Fermentimonas caenicola]|jgi:YidC/Oxa1 family membrane protein insertase|uniref:membrane protein insertase YidC n=1 Tax=Lascolabacillus sp. TaxID=1924068 RepID=UPI000AA48EEC|nr:membrane protein insertase YidC [Lascolabacillus sp.]MBP6175196.1 membrane protein insertase YidC [Fermentimonas sp.]MDI9626398.1 membrane protein insertase YidC [Bacteroidota bacterium]TAH61986.1 MAG: membrane protein insertase YidC [Fermentimonas caenicola]MBP6195975.1 membrane protein insertase YidC [Fermentimonas sp.]MBP7104541.1 membrane protein insertase YidC [Fermentimonas sp.]